MATIIYRTLLRHSTVSSLPLWSSQFASSPSTPALASRNRSTQSGKTQLIEIDLESSSSSSSSWSSSSDSDFEIMAIRKLEDMVQRMIVRRSTPDWLPFVPGSSFWVPPQRSDSLKVIDLVGKLAEPLTEEESLSLTTSRGWPCSEFFSRRHGLNSYIFDAKGNIKKFLFYGRDADPGTVDSPHKEVKEELAEVDVEVEVKVQPSSNSEEER